MAGTLTQGQPSAWRVPTFRHERALARERIGENRFMEIYVSTSLEVCEQRDVKGLYKQARQGKLPDLTGITSPYEPPEDPYAQMASDHTIDMQQQMQALCLEVLRRTALDARTDDRKSSAHGGERT